MHLAGRNVRLWKKIDNPCHVYKSVYVPSRCVRRPSQGPHARRHSCQQTSAHAGGGGGGGVQVEHPASDPHTRTPHTMVSIDRANTSHQASLAPDKYHPGRVWAAHLWALKQHCRAVHRHLRPRIVRCCVLPDATEVGREQDGDAGAEQVSHIQDLHSRGKETPGALGAGGKCYGSGTLQLPDITQ